MSILELLLTIVKFAMEVWRNRSDPEMARLKAVAVATKDMNNDIEQFNKGLINNDAEVLTAHFAQLRDRVARLTAAKNLSP